MPGFTPTVRATTLTLALLVAAALTEQWLAASNHRNQEIAIQQTRERLIRDQFAPTRATIERMFGLAYQSIRTISLLPSVRAINGDNLSAGQDKAVQSGRFSAEGAATIQQLYNNLAANVAVSEIYVVLKGLKPGETPFLMYDELILQNRTDKESDTEIQEDSDVPEESEDAEYAHYPLQIAHFLATDPVFRFDKLNDVPAISSPAMRTCDNSQYLSKKHGDPANATGILYSVPFYNQQNQLNGVISAIFRSNILEALLLNVPFVPVTEKDQQQASNMGFHLPEQPGHFVLANKQFGVFIADRRNQALIDTVKKLVSSNTSDEGIYSGPVDIRDNSQWVLYYQYDPALLAEAVLPLQHQLQFEQIAIALVTLLLLLWIIHDYYQRQQILRAAHYLENMSNGLLDDRMALKAHAELGHLLQALHKMEQQLMKIVMNARNGAAVVHFSAIDISAGNTDLAERTQINVVALEEVNASIHSISDTAQKVAEKTAHTEVLINKASSDAESSLHEIGNTVSAMQQIEEYSADIGGIIAIINEIAARTNLLALNAEIEAARAGVSGKGFAVVATEVRKLAEQSATAAAQVKTLIEDTTTAIKAGSVQVNAASATLAHIEADIQEAQRHVLDISRSTQHQVLSIDEMMHVLGSLSNDAQQNSALVRQTAIASERLDQEATSLKEQMDYFSLPADRQ